MASGKVPTINVDLLVLKLGRTILLEFSALINTLPASPSDSMTPRIDAFPPAKMLAPTQCRVE